jgi:hypothetical protein
MERGIDPTSAVGINDAARQPRARRRKEAQMEFDFGLTTAVKNGTAVESAKGVEKLIAAKLCIDRNDGSSTDIALVEKAQKLGIKREKMAEYLTWLTRTPWDLQRVNAAWATRPKNEGNLLAADFAGSDWKVRSNKGTSYSERLLKGLKLSGHCTYAHSLQGQALEIDHEVMFAERFKIVMYSGS